MAQAATEERYVRAAVVAPLIGETSQQLVVWLRPHGEQRRGNTWPWTLVREVVAEHGHTLPAEPPVDEGEARTTEVPAVESPPAVAGIDPAEPVLTTREVLAFAYAVLDDYREAFARERPPMGDLCRFAAEQAAAAATWRERARQLEEEVSRLRQQQAAAPAVVPPAARPRRRPIWDRDTEVSVGEG